MASWGTWYTSEGGQYWWIGTQLRLVLDSSTETSYTYHWEVMFYERSWGQASGEYDNITCNVNGSSVGYHGFYLTNTTHAHTEYVWSGSQVTVNRTTSDQTVSVSAYVNLRGSSQASETISVSCTVPAKRSATVSYNANEGTGSMASQTFYYGSSVTISSNSFTRAGYDFNGWNTQADGQGTSYTAGSTYSTVSNLTLYAQWALKTYQVTYNGNIPSGASGTVIVPQSQVKTHGTALTLAGAIDGSSLTPPYNFTSWNTQANGQGTTYQAGSTYTINADLSLYAQWTIAYIKPYFTSNASYPSNIPSVYRCDYQGNRSDEGTFVNVKFGWKLDNNFIASPRLSVAVKYRLRGASQWTNATLSTSSSTGSSGTFEAHTTDTQSSHVGRFDIDNAYEVKITISDNSGQTVNYSEYTTYLSTSEFIIDVAPDGKSIAFGSSAPSSYGSDAGCFQVKGSWRFNMPSSLYQWDENASEYVAYNPFANYCPHPIGSWCFFDFDPNDMWVGTTWEQVEGVFLYGSDATHAAGTTGGEASHTLTVDEMPSHNHNPLTGVNGTQTLYTGESVDSTNNQIGVRNNTGASSSSYKSTIDTATVGGGQPHNNMPPYKSVPLWHRINPQE